MTAVSASLRNYHTVLSANEIVLAFGGEIRGGVVTNVMNILDTYLEEENDLSLKRRVQQVVIECVQNIERHSGGFGDGKNQATILLTRQVGGYNISVRNLISSADVDPLKEKIEKINAFSREELMDYYKKSLRENTISAKGGAGLGLIEISRRSGNKIEYEFDAESAEKSRFSLMVTISNKI